MQLGRALILTLGLASPVSADRLADMRQDLAALLLDTKRLRLEMVTTRGAGFINDGSLLDRTAAIENELQRLTGETEELAYRISTIVRDANRRIASLETRVCTLEPGCTVTEFGSTLPIGPDVKSRPDLVLPPEILTISEQSEFDAANRMLMSGDSLSALQMFEDFVRAFPVGPLTQKAHLLLGHGYMDVLEFRLAARAYLEAYSVDEANEVAPSALYHLALAFHRMGNAKEGCLTLSEVQFRYADLDIAADAKQAEAELACV
jgi:TolA-binding protein